MEFEWWYVVCSFWIAMCVWAEATMLDKNSGKFPKNAVFGVISLSTSVWLVVSMAALYFFHFDRFEISVPIVYGIYSVAGWVYGARLMGNDVPDDIGQFVVPQKYLIFSKSFALVFGLLCLFVLIIPYFI